MVQASGRGIIGAMRPARHLLHFTLLGALLFGAERRLATLQPTSIPATRVSERIAAYARETGAAPDARVYALLERDARDEELLASEARRLGLDRDDAVVRERLVSNMLVAQAGPRAAPLPRGDGESSEAQAWRRDAAPERLYREALALGMDASDALVRRRLAARMTARLRADAARAAIDEATLRAWFDAHRDAYEQPAAVRFEQVCFARNDRAGEAELRASSALASLRDAASGSAAASLRGDPCLFGKTISLRSEAELERGFGAAFARAALAADVGVWTGPIASSQGVHLVRVQERSAGRGADFESVRVAVRDACTAERQDAALRDGVARLRARYAAQAPR
jgi:hypothetical protein